jgi:hypothetical protein
MTKVKGSYNFSIGEPPIPNEDDFTVNEALAYMQQGLPASYDFSDYIYVVEN